MVQSVIQYDLDSSGVLQSLNLITKCSQALSVMSHTCFIVAIQKECCNHHPANHGLTQIHQLVASPWVITTVETGLLRTSLLCSFVYRRVNELLRSTYKCEFTEEYDCDWSHVSCFYHHPVSV